MLEIVLDGMHGLGDNLHERAVVRQHMANGRVYLTTSWPQFFQDMRGPRLAILPVESNLRTQHKNRQRNAALYDRIAMPRVAQRHRVFYTKEQVWQHGSILRAMIASSGGNPNDSDFRLPVPEAWRAKARTWIDRWHPERPLLMYRPLVLRNEWRGCASRNPDALQYAALLRSIRDDFYVVSIADTEPNVEWIVSPEVQPDAVCHRGELDAETIAALASVAGLVFCSPGFALAMGIAVGAPVVTVFGAHEDSSVYRETARWGSFLGIDTVQPCKHFVDQCACSKRIDFEIAAQKLRSFVDAHIAKDRAIAA